MILKVHQPFVGRNAKRYGQLLLVYCHLEVRMLSWICNESFIIAVLPDVDHFLKCGHLLIEKKTTMQVLLVFILLKFYVKIY